MIFAPIAAFVFAYLLGSIPFGLLLTRAAGLGDIRAMGSGNIGATNVLRTGGKKLAALTLLLDAGKGAAAVLIAGSFAQPLGSLAALGAVLGHMFPVWLKFKGGKGVAPGIGVITALNWPTGAIVFALWLPVVATTRISSLSTLIVCGMVPILLAVFGRADLVPLALAIIALIFFKHRENIRRLLKHTEPKIGSHTNGTPSPERR
jgi:glycerol-3-phosphate acyltransferase PlsY